MFRLSGILKKISAVLLSLSLVVMSPLGGFFSTAAPVAHADAVADQEANLQAQLAAVLAQIAAQQQVLSAEQAKGQSIQRDINILDSQISEAQLEIQAHNLAIQALGKDINTKTATINTLTGKISDADDSLAQLLRETNEMDAFSLPDVVLSNEDISEFFLDQDAYDTVKQSIQTALGQIEENKDATVQARQDLNTQQLQQIDQRISIQTEEDSIQSSEDQKAKLLSLSKAQQATYQSVIAVKQKQADAIRSALFSLRDTTTAINFGQALQYADQAQKVTGVDPAFLLAILTQESDLGENVGSCYVTDLTTGDGVKASTGAAISGIMKPSRDLQPFIDITKAVGRDPTQTRVSCPQGGGYGGAMGPAQFIPSTWVLFEPRLVSALGISNPDPWDPLDAFMASALYLSDLGASGSDAASERNAACKYYSGRSCDSRTPANSFYGNDVMAKASSIQVNEINILQPGS